MKEVWYLYQNGVNYGQRDRGTDAVREVYAMAGENLPLETLITAVQKGCCVVNEFKALREMLKV